MIALLLSGIALLVVDVVVNRAAGIAAGVLMAVVMLGLLVVFPGIMHTRLRANGAK